MFTLTNNHINVEPVHNLASVATSTLTMDDDHDKIEVVQETTTVSAIVEEGDASKVRRIKKYKPDNLLLKPFKRLDPTIHRLLLFLNCFGLTINLNRIGDTSDDENYSMSLNNLTQKGTPSQQSLSKLTHNQNLSSLILIQKKNSNNERRQNIYKSLLSCSKLVLMVFVVVLTGDVIYDMNIRQSKLLEEQRRSTPLLTFVIVSYSWLSLVIPIICDICLVIAGSHLFRFYSRTMSTVCNGSFFGVKTSVDQYFYYILLISIALIDAVGQLMMLGIWPQFLDPYMKIVISEKFFLAANNNGDNNMHPTIDIVDKKHLSSDTANNHYSVALNDSLSVSEQIDQTNINHDETNKSKVVIIAPILNLLIGKEYSQNDFGVCLRLFLLIVHFMHTYSFLIIMIFLAHHFANCIRGINKDINKLKFRHVLRQLVILRDSSEQLSLIMSVPFALIILLVFMRLISLFGVFIQSTMKTHENWAISLQSFASSTLIIMVFIYCDNLQSSSKQTHRLKTEQTVINGNSVNQQSLHEYLDYLKRLTKSIRITFFNIITINKSSLVGLYGHILTLTFVTS